MKHLPLYNAIKEYSGSSPARFHMPGHKGFLSPFDVTELSCTDDLQRPSAAIMESEALCAKALSAREAFFLVNGSSAGILAMLFAVGSGKRILLGRNCHKSAINGIALADQEAIPLFPDRNGVYSAEAVDEALEEHPCDAVFLTSPTYRGCVSPINDIAEAAHRHGALLLVDSAHGAHFAFSKNLPPVPSAADMWCVSTHKTLFAMTQTAMLLMGESCPIPAWKVQKALNMFQSTSPSYEMMLSIERSVLEAGDWEKHTERMLAFRSRIKEIPGVTLLCEANNYERDVTRLNIALYGSTGYELGDLLEENNIYPEMADRECVTLITSPEDPDEWYERLFKALNEASSIFRNSENAFVYDEKPVFGEKACSVREAVTGNTETVPLEASVGRICSAAVGCYPPGTAVLFPGERINEEAVSRLISDLNAGAKLFGMTNGFIEVLA